MSKKEHLAFKPSDMKKELKQRKKSNMKKQVNETVVSVQQIVSGLTDLVLSVSLAIVVTCHSYDLWVRPVGHFEYYARLIATGVIGLLAAHAVMKTLKKIGESK